MKELNDRGYGKYGYYIVKDGKIKIELYMNRQHGMMYMFAKPVSTGIQFYKSQPTGFLLLGGLFNATRTTDGGFYKKGYVITIEY